MSNSIGYAGPSVTSFPQLDHVLMEPSEVSAARRMIVKHVPVEEEVELRLMLGVHHD